MRKTVLFIAIAFVSSATTGQGTEFQPEPIPAVQGECMTNAAGGNCEVVYPNSLIKVLEVSQTYQRNEAAADANFTDKKLVFSGQLVRVARSIDKDGKPIYAAELSPDGKPAKNFALAFHFKKEDRDQLRCLTVGDHVRFEGVSVGVVTEDPAPGAPARSEIQFIKCKVVQ